MKIHLCRSSDIYISKAQITHLKLTGWSVKALNFGGAYSHSTKVFNLLHNLYAWGRWH